MKKTDKVYMKTEVDVTPGCRACEGAKVAHTCARAQKTKRRAFDADGKEVVEGNDKSKNGKRGPDKAKRQLTDK